MADISPEVLLRVWEHAQLQPPALRALSLLRIEAPSAPLHELAALSIGERDQRLLNVRERCLGAGFDATSRCPNCHEQVELAFATDDLRSAAADSGREVSVEHAPWSVVARPACSADLLGVALDSAQAPRALLERCLLKVEREGVAANPSELPDEVALLVEQALADADALIELHCAACDERYELAFDVANYFWSELATHAHRLLGEVHTLARAYGWSEAEVLALSPLRRRYYLELVVSC
ncbi:MAG TPA: hypothetical protein VFN67_13740 [Polyangiales bacterium]|nr:hypothetical protein [Polyangiales bacterium]